MRAISKQLCFSFLLFLHTQPFNQPMRRGFSFNGRDVRGQMQRTEITPLLTETLRCFVAFYSAESIAALLMGNFVERGGMGNAGHKGKTKPKTNSVRRQAVF